MLNVENMGRQIQSCIPSGTCHWWTPAEERDPLLASSPRRNRCLCAAMLNLGLIGVAVGSVVQGLDWINGVYDAAVAILSNPWSRPVNELNMDASKNWTKTQCTTASLYNQRSRAEQCKSIDEAHAAVSKGPAAVETCQLWFPRNREPYHGSGSYDVHLSLRLKRLKSMCCWKSRTRWTSSYLRYMVV